MGKRKALGKGLSALIPDGATLEEEDGRFFQCPIEAIEPNPYQPRQSFRPDELREMADSIREKGVLTPLLVNRSKGGYQLIAGERRWRAAQIAGLERVPVVVREATPVESLELALIENIHRKDLNPIEEAIAYRKLIEDMGVTQEVLAKRLGKERSTVANLLRLLKLPLQIQQDLIDGHITMGHARVLAGIKNPGDQQAFRRRILKDGLSVRQLENVVKHRYGKRKGDGKKREVDSFFETLENDLKRSLGTKVSVKRKGREGKIVIYFYSDDELERLMERLS
ncbi:MAG: ParB/RepB/Spo0J family partition protein [Deltaproteobacteria bacterium]|nr:ParB/RepB/Spo0J family partition protein [Deltaproteobacteria bacterium]